jgi:hypothetical protein
MLQFYYYVILFDSDFEKSLAIMNACEVSLRLFQAYIPSKSIGIGSLC